MESLIPKPSWRERIEHRRIKNRLKKLNRRYYVLDITNVTAVKELREEAEPLQNRHDLYETRKLQRMAQQVAVEIPTDNRDWWRIVLASELTGVETFRLPVELLTEIGQIGARKLIREERFRVMEKWVAVLIPVLSLVVAILALTQNRC